MKMRDCLHELNNIALLLCLLYLVASMTDRCTRLFNRPTVLALGSGQLVTVNFLRVDFVNVVLCDELTCLIATG